MHLTRKSLAGVLLSLPVLAIVAVTSVSAGAETGTIEGKVLGRERYVVNTVVGLAGVPGEFKPPSEPVIMDQKAMQFVPRVLPIVKGTTVKFTNSDPAEHTVFSPDNETYDLGAWGQGGSKTRKFDELGAYTQLCKLHALMVASIVVRDNPFFTVTDATGTFKIENVPAGAYDVEIWNERMKAEPVKVTVTAGETSTVEIELTR